MNLSLSPKQQSNPKSNFYSVFPSFELTTVRRAALFGSDKKEARYGWKSNVNFKYNGTSTKYLCCLYLHHLRYQQRLLHAFL